MRSNATAALVLITMFLAVSGREALLTDADVKENLEMVRESDRNLLEGGFMSNLLAILTGNSFQEMWEGLHGGAVFGVSVVAQYFSSPTFERNNFVDGFRENDFDETDCGFGSWVSGGFSCPRVPKPRWRAPVKGEKVNVISYADLVSNTFSVTLNSSVTGFLSKYYTGTRVPSWEDNEQHEDLQNTLERAIGAARLLNIEPITNIYNMEVRFAFDQDATVRATWNGFPFMGPREIRYASNGVFGMDLLTDMAATNKDTLGILATETVFGAHLKYDSAADEYFIDLTSLERYRPLDGYAALGGKAFFKKEGNLLRTVRLQYGNKTFTDFSSEEVEKAFKESRLIGWRFAEKAIISSLVAMTNLVMHVKDLHLELAAAFQAVTIDSFAANPKHPIRRLLDPFIHRSIQATNGNFKLLFDYKAAEFSLAPLPSDEQLRLIDDAVREQPLNLAELDMDKYRTAKGRNIPAEDQEASGFWVWGYRTKTVQKVYENMVECWLDSNGITDESMAEDELLQGWWKEMLRAVPAVKEATVTHPDWAAPGKLTRKSFVNVAKVLMLWLSWVHEDVGHAAAAFVYNPVHTPMAVPSDGVGVPFRMHVFNVIAYRSFVFLERSKLLEQAPAFWFSPDTEDDKCYSGLTSALQSLASSQPQFSKCDDTGFYTCVDRVETAVSS